MTAIGSINAHPEAHLIGVLNVEHLHVRPIYIQSREV